MDRTIFAGLTILGPDESLSADGGSFLNRNIRTIDQLLTLGAVSHRHDAHPALLNPNAAPTVMASASGGTIDPGTVGWFGFTVIDSDGGETSVSPLGSAATPQPFAPPLRPASATVDYASGTLRADTYYYGVTLLDGMGGETTLGPTTRVTRNPGYASGQVILSGLDEIVAASPGAAGYAVYRSARGGQWAYVASGTVASFTDDGTLCADCLREPPDSNTTRKTTKFVVTVPALASGQSFRLYGSTAPTMTTPALYGEYPVASAGTTIDVATMAFSPGSPPPINLSKGGAHKIDPATEIVTPVSSLLPLASGITYAGSGWASAAYTITLGEVHLAGAVASAGALASAQVVGTLPPGTRPTERYAARGQALGDRSTVPFDVTPAGDVVLAVAPSGAVFLDARWRL